MQPICANCGKPINGVFKYLCDECCHNLRSENVKRLHFCVDCGEPFIGAPRSKYCPDCRHTHKLAITAEWRKHGPSRKIGTKDKCIVCGAEYTVEGGLQRYCPACSEKETKANIAERKKENYKTNGMKRNFVKSRICPTCGHVYTANASKYCSDECKEYGKYYNLAVCYLNKGKRKSPPKTFDEWKKKIKNK